MKTRQARTKDDEPAKEGAADEEAQPTPTDMEAADRRLYNFLSFWRVCKLKRCRRGRCCRGEVKACKARHWPLVPEEAKAWLFKAFTFRAAGLSPDEAATQATREVNEANELLARLEREQAAARDPASAQIGANGDASESDGVSSPAASDMGSATRRRDVRPVARVRQL